MLLNPGGHKLLRQDVGVPVVRPAVYAGVVNVLASVIVLERLA